MDLTWTQMGELQNGWDTYGTALAPAPETIMRAMWVTKKCNERQCMPLRKSPSVEGGVGIDFWNLTGRYACIEFLNDGTASLVLLDENREATAESIELDTESLLRSVGRVVEFIGQNR